jgi:hypothetical protein
VELRRRVDALEDALRTQENEKRQLAAALEESTCRALAEHAAELSGTLQGHAQRVRRAARCFVVVLRLSPTPVVVVVVMW